MSDTLKPCPCCSSGAVKTIRGGRKGKYIYRVYCTLCQLRTWMHPKKKDAISVWNKRPKT